MRIDPSSILVAWRDVENGLGPITFQPESVSPQRHCFERKHGQREADKECLWIPLPTANKLQELPYNAQSLHSSHMSDIIVNPGTVRTCHKVLDTAMQQATPHGAVYLRNIL